MTDNRSDDHVVFCCDDQGKIQKVMHDSLGMETIIVPGIMFPSTVQREDMGKALNFLLEIRTNGSAVGWDFNFFLGDSIISLHFAGLKESPLILMAGSKSERAMLRFLRNRRDSQDQSIQEDRRNISPELKMELERESESIYYDGLARLYNEISYMHRELAKKNVELERMNALKNQFLGMAAHDLRTSLWTIQMYSRFLLEEIQDTVSGEQLALLKTIMESSENLKNIVSNYLDIATIESGRLQLNLKSTDLVSLCQNSVRLNGILADVKQIRLSLKQESLPKLNLDAARIEQVLNNLIHNAIKFSPPQTEIQVDIHGSKDEAIISVQDEGVGIPSDVVDILFEPFERGCAAGTAEERGAGLGLAIARKVIHEHGGRIWVESKVGEGSKFSVSLPFNP